MEKNIQNQEQALTLIKNMKKGRIASFGYEKVAKLPKKFEGHTLIVQSEFQGMFGEYGNRQSVIEKKANEDPNEPKKEIKFNLKPVIQGVLFEKEDGSLIVRVLPIEGKHKKTYIYDGEEVSVEFLREQGLSDSAIGIHKGSGRPDCMSLSLKNIVYIK